MFKRIIALLAVCLIIPSMLFSCKNDGDAEITKTVYYTVTFDSNGGSAIASQKVAQGAKVSLPVLPIRENYVFDKWTASGGKDWNFDSDTVMSDMTLTAQWISAENLFTYEAIEDTDTAAITGLKKGSAALPENIVLPDAINGLRVVAIGDGAFKDLSSEDISSITLPAGIVKIGEEAFANCADMVITVKGILTSVGACAFIGCNKLTEVTLGEGLEHIFAETFLECGIKKIILPNSLKAIGEDAFKSCTELTVVVISALSADTETVIENSAFRECESLRTVFFRGSDSELDSLIDRTADGNELFVNAKFSLYSETEPTVEGDFWHIVDGEPREW